jgi:hypothetical protein
MSLHRRVARLTMRLPGPRPKGVQTDPAALLAGLRDGTVRLEDLDWTDYDQSAAVAYVTALLISRTGMGGER